MCSYVSLKGKMAQEILKHHEHSVKKKINSLHVNSFQKDNKYAQYIKLPSKHTIELQF